MRSFIVAIVAGALAVSGVAFAQEAQPAKPPPAEQKTPEQKKAEEARIRAINAYVQVLFAREVEKRCEHLGGKQQAEFTKDVATVDGYMQENLPKEIVEAVQKKAETAGADEKTNPCGKDSKTFVEKSAEMTGQLSDSIKKAQQ